MSRKKGMTRAKAKMFEDFKKFKYWQPEISPLDKQIRCKCRKYYGLRNRNRTCDGCNTKVEARGL